MTDPTNTNDLDALRLDLARAHAGYTIELSQDNTFLVVQNDRVLMVYKKRKWAERFIVSQVPDWPRDVAAALALCHEIGEAHFWDLVTYRATMGGKTCLVAKFYTHDVHPCVMTHGVAAFTDAEALARLALDALRAIAP